MDRSDIRGSYWKTTLGAGATFVAGALTTIWLAEKGDILDELLAVCPALVAVFAASVAAGGLFALRRESDQEHGRGWIPRSVDGRRVGFFRGRGLRVGDWVEVRSAEEILATLDANGMLDSLPFMPEMLRFCGKRFIVSQRADKILDMIGDKRGFRLRRMRDAVFLDNVRCDGLAHGGCQQGCKTIWKTAWLRRVDPGDAGKASVHDASDARARLQPLTIREQPAGAKETVYRCQATELLSASEPMHPWDPRVDLRALVSGNVRFRDFILVLLGRFFNFVQDIRGGCAFPTYALSGRTRTPEGRLNLQPGEWVEVKRVAEIVATLDATGRNRGMRFDREMVRYCGGRYRVKSRVERLIDERTGLMLVLRNSCIILEGVEATGEFLRFNPQREFPYWREIWLRRVSGEQDPKS